MLDIEPRGETTVVRVIGECDFGSRDALTRTLAEVAATGVPRVIVSLDACEYIDSSIVTALLQYRNKLRERFVLGVPEDRRSIHRILAVLGLHATLDVRPAV
jgi:anti-anti-sigma factor